MVLKQYFLLFLIVGIAWQVSADVPDNVSLPVPVDVAGTHVASPSLDGHIAYVDSTGCELTQAQAIHQCANLKALSHHSPNLGFMAAPTWFLFSATNSADTTKTVYLEISYPLLDHIGLSVFSTDNQLITHWDTGDAKPFNQRPVNHPSFLFPLTLSPQETQHVRIYVETGSAMQVPLHIWSPERLASATSTRLMVFGLFIGAMLIMALYNSLLFVSTREKTYLFFALTLLSYGLLQVSITGIGYAYLWPSSPQWNDKSVFLTGSFAIIQLNLFTYYFLRLSTNSVVTKRLMIAGMVINSLGLLVSPFVEYKYLIAGLSMTVGFFPLVVYAKGVKLWLSGYQPARYFVLAFTCFVIATCVFVLNKFTLLPHNLFTEYSIHFGAAGVVTMLSMALAERVNQEKWAREQAQSEAIATLQKYEDIVQNSSEGLFRLDLDGRFLSANRAMLSFINVSDIVALQQRFSTIEELVCESGSIVKMAIAQGQLKEDVRLCCGDDKWGQLSLRLVCDAVDKVHIIEGALIDISDRKTIEEKLTYLANVDQLTGLDNRNAFQHSLHQLLDDARKKHAEHALLYLDMDRFKLVNDTCGHHAGDELLRQLGALLRHTFDQQASIARIGGDEFAIILRDISRAEVESLTASLRLALRRYRFMWQGKQFDVGASIGIVPVNAETDSVTGLLNKADSVCMLAKKQGRDRVVYLDEDLEDVKQQVITKNMVATIHDAIDHDLFGLFRQKILSLHTDSFNGYEVLLRIKQQEDLLGPAGFIPAAERYNMMPDIDKWVVTHFVKYLSQHPQVLADLDMATVNLSGQTLSQPEFSAYLINLLQQYPHVCTKLCFELTESAALNNLADCSELMTKIKQYGVQFAVDDFGSGYASYNYLTQLPVDYVKIDGSFCIDIETNAVNQMVVRSITEIAHTMGTRVIAEFVETPEALACLREIGVDFVQGYFVEKPAPLAHPSLTRPTLEDEAKPALYLT